MATADQIRALVESFGEADRERFYRIALQVAAHEARQGHTRVAQQLRDAIDEAQQKNSRGRRKKDPIPIAEPRGELEGVLSTSYPDTRLRDMVLDADTRETLRRLLKENRQRHRLREHGLQPRRKLLLVGPPGTGKTMTARTLAGDLQLPLFVVRFDSLISRYMGETAAKLRLVFDAMEAQPGVYLFDEFDAVGTQRNRGDDLGEIRRVLNSFLQFIEADKTESLIIAATNHPEMLDRALFRRFDDVVQYELPDTNERIATLKNYLSPFDTTGIDWQQAGEDSEGLSHADLQRAAEDAAKEMILAEETQIETDKLLQSIQNRQNRSHLT